jgi:hypothetical protein
MTSFHFFGVSDGNETLTENPVLTKLHVWAGVTHSNPRPLKLQIGKGVLGEFPIVPY